MICAVIPVEMRPVEIFREVTAGAAQSTWPSKQLRFLDAVVPKAKAGKGKTRLSSWTLDYSQHVACSLGLGPNEIIPPDLCGLRAAQTRPHLPRILSADIPRPGDKPAPPQITHYLPPHLPPSVPSLPALRGGVSSTPHVMPSPRCHSKPSHCIVMPFKRFVQSRHASPHTQTRKDVHTITTEKPPSQAISLPRRTTDNHTHT